MERQFPIYTVEAECQDCYKCLRQCPVKAIRIEQSHARVTPSSCVVCGGCVEVCPVHAKKIRDDRGRARHLLGRNTPVYVSLAPSWVSEFPGVSPEQMASALKRMGYAGVSETALGAQEVSAALAEALRPNRPGIHISSACPSAVNYLRKYLPQHTTAITQLYSPVLAHCRLLHTAFGDNIHIVFFGPCIAKKMEADAHPDLLDLALTFDDLRACFVRTEITPETLLAGKMESFVPRLAEEGALYPVEGGMTETIRALGDFNHVRFITVTGLENIRRTLAGFDMERLNGPVFIEALACEGGCISGPCTAGAGALLNKRLAVEQAAIMPEIPVTRTPQVAIGARFYPEPVEKVVAESNKIREALLRVGKKTAEDELNCSGCGYNTCREFAAALIAGNAEPTMCVSYMRNLAQKKANALLRSMPSGVVIVDETLHIIECNERFGRMFGQDISDIYDACPGLNRCALSKVLPFTDMFTNVLHSGEEVHYDHYRSNGRLLNITVFSLEPGRVAGAIILDVTRQELRRDQIAQKAQEVIRRNLGTVQEIACRLGEHMAETEILLRSIAEGYAADDGCGLTERKPDDRGGRS